MRKINELQNALMAGGNKQKESTQD